MGFRDDKDATRARAEALQRELDDALKELGRLQISQLESSAEADALRSRVAELEKTRDAPAPSGQGGTKPLFYALSFLLVGLSAAMAYQRCLSRSAEEAAEARRAQQLERERILRAHAEERAAVERADPVAPAPVEPALEESPEPAAAPTRHVDLTWTAMVVRVEGRPALRRGARCTVRAGLDSDGAHLTSEVDVTCGDAPLYRWADSLGSGTQMRSCSVNETKARGDAFNHGLTCNDLGARTGRPQLALDTEGHSATVWSEAAPTFRVELSLQGDGAAPGPPLVAENEHGGDSFTPVARSARVTGTTGTAPVQRGAQCRVRVDPTPGDQNCRVEVRCGETALYGSRSSNGYNHCQVTDRAFTLVRDERSTGQGGDPRLFLHLASRRAVISDDDPSYEVTLSLSP